ncbi:hypothetical protein PROFUN_01273 [Planoprotostelium fungivorum]|uniref:Uncharacterized protein n=1 Tax=Planoprotostelium fungivorum TaxID=1890364 RepID=A0A2P6NZN5_9EUKA|nr:hypothetical protein PROFUN_01273 [Planoprotostelium fungivorum]
MLRGDHPKLGRINSRFQKIRHLYQFPRETRHTKDEEELDDEEVSAAVVIVT